MIEHHNKAVIGIMSLEKYRERTIAIAKGQYIPKKNEPKIWFSSIKSLANVLSEENQQLIRLILEKNCKFKKCYKYSVQKNQTWYDALESNVSWLIMIASSRGRGRP